MDTLHGQHLITVGTERVATIDGRDYEISLRIYQRGAHWIVAEVAGGLILIDRALFTDSAKATAFALAQKGKT